MQYIKYKVCWPICCLASIVLGVAGCAEDMAADRSGQRVLLFAAASTADVMDEICSRFSREHKIDVRTSYASSGTLAGQIVHGARAEVFVCANRRWADYLDQQDLVARRRDALGNRLVVIVPAGSPVKVQRPEDLLGKEIRYLALANPESAPAGIYAKQALVELELWDRLESKIVSGADVRWALAYVQRAEAEAGIVYATDAAISKSVEVALVIPAELTDPIRYPVMLLQEGSGNRAAKAFYDYLLSPPAAEIFRKHGFEPIRD